MEEEKKEKIDEETNETILEKINKFNIFCFSPQLGFSEILKKDPFSIIFTSGTLSPFKLYENELQIKFDITLENEHIVSNDQINFNILKNYQEGFYRFDYNNRNNKEMIKALGNEIINICKNVQYGGILVFFPSFYYLNECKKIWNDYGINKKIENHKRIYIDSSKDKNLITQIKEDIKKNYIFFSVFRGIASEGIDFSNDSARAVICIGIPFADISDNRIKLKMDYLNNLKKENSDLISGNEWYKADAMTAVNQSLGRVIRHKNDYGTMLCIDERYNNYLDYFSFWIRDNYEKLKSKEHIKINDFLNEQREKFKDIIPNNRNSYNQNNFNTSGFNSTIKIDNKLFLDNTKNHEEILNEKEMDIVDEDEEQIDINSENEFNSSKEKNNNSLKKLQSNNIFHFQKVNEEKINTINIKEIKYKTNYDEILKSMNFKEPKEKIEVKMEKENDLFEEWNTSNKNKNKNNIDIIFEKEEKQAKKLLEELKLFVIQNPKEFNNILKKHN